MLTKESPRCFPAMDITGEKSPSASIRNKDGLYDEVEYPYSNGDREKITDEFARVILSKSSNLSACCAT
jgi:hypothetical protein